MNTSAIDRVSLLDRVGGDEELLREITSIFLAEYPELLRSIQNGLAAGDAQRVERAAHSLKGSVANFGADSATQAAYRLETIGRKGSLHRSSCGIRGTYLAIPTASTSSGTTQRVIRRPKPRAVL